MVPCSWDALPFSIIFSSSGCLGSWMYCSIDVPGKTSFPWQFRNGSDKQNSLNSRLSREQLARGCQASCQKRYWTSWVPINPIFNRNPKLPLRCLILHHRMPQMGSIKTYDIISNGNPPILQQREYRDKTSWDAYEEDSLNGRETKLQDRKIDKWEIPRKNREASIWQRWRIRWTFERFQELPSRFK